MRHDLRCKLTQVESRVNGKGENFITDLGELQKMKENMSKITETGRIMVSSSSSRTTKKGRMWDAWKGRHVWEEQIHTDLDLIIWIGRQLPI